ncbi:hypothetical protein O6H91_21G013500 [Diphasiastrum complanatum]|uniref:Uncharacterized protein n=1 Tax=Diphasiastrum complanatum TaxID=34168 RepID=A0ACC2AHY2_DIPCM|nr:hypothetical protein O6H91_21G013500 [Diphasiastrum complanatum]
MSFCYALPSPTGAFFSAHTFRKPNSTFRCSHSSAFPAADVHHQASSSILASPIAASNDQKLSAAGTSKVVVSMALAMALGCLAVCTPVGALAPSSTPYSRSQSEQMQLGLANGRIRPCPSDVNPNCVSTSSKDAGYAYPWVIPESSSSNVLKRIERAILFTQKNPKIVQMETTADGQYLLAEVDGLIGRDALEFLVRGDVVLYRSMAQKVVYVYPFTTPLSDFGTQKKHIKALEDELGWGSGSFDSVD